MSHEPKDIRGQRPSLRRKQAVLDRISAALDNVDRENRDLRTQVAEYQGALVDLRAGFENIIDATDSADPNRLRLSDDNTSQLRRAAHRIGVVSDIWSERARRRDFPESA